MLFIGWFCKVVREQCCFHIGFVRSSTKKVLLYTGFTRVAREQLYKTIMKLTFFMDNPPGTIWGQEEGEEYSILPVNSPGCTIESPLARPHSFASLRPLARSALLHVPSAGGLSLPNVALLLSCCCCVRLRYPAVL